MKSSYLTKGGVFTALSILFIYLSIIFPINKLYLLGLASCIIPLSILATDIRNGAIVYAAVSLLSLILFGPKAAVMGYILFFGLYGFVKYYIEKLRKVPLEFFLKFAFFNFSIFILFFFYKTLFTDITKTNFPFYILLLGMQFVFLVYDYTLTVFISYVNDKILKKLG